MGVAVKLTPMFTKPQLNSIANSLTWVWCWIGVIVTSSTQTHYYTHVCSAGKDRASVAIRPNYKLETPASITLAIQIQESVFIECMVIEYHILPLFGQSTRALDLGPVGICIRAR